MLQEQNALVVSENDTMQSFYCCVMRMAFTRSASPLQRCLKMALGAQERSDIRGRRGWDLGF